MKDFDIVSFAIGVAAGQTFVSICAMLVAQIRESMRRRKMRRILARIKSEHNLTLRGGYRR